MLRTLVFALTVSLTIPAVAQTDLAWESYTDSTYGFSAELPTGWFAPVDDPDRPGISLVEVGGFAELSLYGGPAEGMTRDRLEDRLATGEQVSDITYRAGGDSWFVLSGYYQADDLADRTIFYTKVMFSPDQQTFSAFEISFPIEDKPRLAPMIEYFEDNFTRPRA